MAHHIYHRAKFLRRMRGALPYADIVALDPAVFVQLRYAEYDGAQVLFQDAACTVPVTTPGQHTIGGVRSIIDGSIVATQATAAHRPLWMGEDVGARLDGVDDHFDIVADLTTLTAAHLFVTPKLTADPPASGKTGLWALQPDDGTVDDTAFPFTDGNIYEGAFASSRAPSVDPGVDLSAARRTYEVISDGASYDQLIDGGGIQSSSARFAATRSNPELGYSRSSSGALRMLSGSLAEFVVFGARQNVDGASAVRASLAGAA